MFNKLKEKAKESAKEAKRKVEEIQESFGETKEEQYSDEKKQKELADLHKLAVEIENILNNWENKGDETKEAIQKLKEYRDNKPIIWESYNNRTKSEENPGGWAVSLLNNLKAKTKKTRESTWGFKGKIQGFTLSKEIKGEVSSEKVSENKIEEVNKQYTAEVVEEVVVKEEKKSQKLLRKHF
jgi:hypothetical protein